MANKKREKTTYLYSVSLFVITIIIIYIVINESFDCFRCLVVKVDIRVI